MDFILYNINMNRRISERRAPPASVAAVGEEAREQIEATVLRQFRVVFRSVKKHFQWVEDRCGVSGAQLWAMAKIGQAPGLRVSELAQALSIHLSTASNLLDRLEKLGLVRRERLASDQRIVALHLTAAGSKIVARAPEPFQGVLPDALAGLPEPVLRGLHDHLATLVDFMKVRDATGNDTPLSEL